MTASAAVVGMLLSVCHFILISSFVSFISHESGQAVSSRKKNESVIFQSKSIVFLRLLFLKEILGAFACFLDVNMKIKL